MYKRQDFDLSEMRAMSFNVYCANLTNERVDRVLDIVEKYLPDTFGVQEATLNWMRIFHNKLGHIYKYVGVGRDGEARGEYRACLLYTSLSVYSQTACKGIHKIPVQGCQQGRQRQTV